MNGYQPTPINVMDMDWLNNYQSVADYNGRFSPSYNTVPTQAVGASPDFFSMESFLGNPKTGNQGWGMPALGAVTSLANSWLAFKNYGLAKDQLAFGKEQFNKNYEAQRNLTNSHLADRQAARVAANPNDTMSVADYMAKWGI